MHSRVTKCGTKHLTAVQGQIILVEVQISLQSVTTSIQNDASCYQVVA